MIKYLVLGMENVNQLIGIAVGSISGIIIAWMNLKGSTKRSALEAELNKAKTELEGLKRSFSICFDAYERDYPETIGMWKDFKKEHEL
jgi:uncharacterized membrane-anchored protein YhcB (DUF1043 family)